MILLKPINPGFLPFTFPSDEVHRLASSNLLVIVLLIIGFLFMPFVYYLGLRLRKREKIFDRLMFGIGATLCILEILKQITYAKMYDYLPGGSNVGHYYWPVFPFQLCSLHMFFCLLIPFFKGRVKQNFNLFIGLYAFIGGFAVLIGGLGMVLAGFELQSGEWVGDWFLAFHTLIWHVILMNLGALVFGYYRLASLNFRYITKVIKYPWIMCTVFLLIAQFLNVFVPLLSGNDVWVENFNMWNISRIYSYNLPFIKLFLTTDPAWIGGVIGTVVYALMLYAGAYVVIAFMIGIKYIIDKISRINIYTQDIRY